MFGPYLWAAAVETLADVLDQSGSQEEAGQLRRAQEAEPRR
jgi:hypothetical protein